LLEYLLDVLQKHSHKANWLYVGFNVLKAILKRIAKLQKEKSSIEANL